MRTVPGAGRALIAVFVASLLASTPARGQAPAPPPAYDAPPPPPPLTLSPPGGYLAPPGGILVEVRASSPNVRIERVTGQIRTPVCYAPCRQVLSTSDVYAIGGSGVRSTSSFMLPTDRPQVTLDVHAGSSAQLAAGAGVILTGVIVGYLGYFVMVAGGFGDTVNAVNGRQTNNAGVGLAIGLGGLALAGVGVLIAINARTTVATSTGSTFTLDTPPRRRKPPAIALTARGLEF